MYFSQRVVPFQSYIVMQLLESRVKALLPSPDQGPGVTEPSIFGEPFEYQVAEVSRPAVHPSQFQDKPFTQRLPFSAHSIAIFRKPDPPLAIGFLLSTP